MVKTLTFCATSLPASGCAERNTCNRFVKFLKTGSALWISCSSLRLDDFCALPKWMFGRDNGERFRLGGCSGSWTCSHSSSISAICAANASSFASISLRIYDAVCSQWSARRIWNTITLVGVSLYHVRLHTCSATFLKLIRSANESLSVPCIDSLYFVLKFFGTPFASMSSYVCTWMWFFTKSQFLVPSLAWMYAYKRISANRTKSNKIKHF